MSGGPACICKPKDRKNWSVIKRNCRQSAFDGYRVKWSPYSTVHCLRCIRVWRTKAAYVADLPDHT